PDRGGRQQRAQDHHLVAKRYLSAGQLRWPGANCLRAGGYHLYPQEAAETAFDSSVGSQFLCHLPGEAGLVEPADGAMTMHAPAEHSGYDIIGDIHGCARTLARLLEQMGYRLQQGVWR